MKLKKIAALALAGVMAVSMLAACGDGSSSAPTTETPVASSLTEKVVAKLGKNVTDKVTFTADATLQSVLNKLVANEGYAGVSTADVEGSDLYGMDPTLATTTSVIPKVDLSSFDDDSDGAEPTFITAVQTTTAATEDLAVAQLANAIATEAVSEETVTTIAGLPDYSAANDTDKYYYTYEYTGDMAVAAVTDPTTAQTIYVAAFTVARTTTKVEK